MRSDEIITYKSVIFPQTSVIMYLFLFVSLECDILYFFYYLYAYHIFIISNKETLKHFYSSNTEGHASEFLDPCAKFVKKVTSRFLREVSSVY